MTTPGTVLNATHIRTPLRDQGNRGPGGMPTHRARGARAWLPPRSLLALLLALLALLTPAPARGQDLEWNRRNSGPAQPGAMAYDAARGVTVFFGGAQTWEWDGTIWTQRMVTGPSARSSHAMAYDAAREVTVLFGGILTACESSSNFADTWEWDGATWTQRDVTGPPARSGHAMVYDAARGVTVLFGGYNGCGHPYCGWQFPSSFADTWEWDGATWTQRQVPGPPARGDHAMAYDAARGVTVLFGGHDGYATAMDDTWEWDGTSWTQRVVTGPGKRGAHAMVYDAARGVTVLFGGGVVYPEEPYWHLQETWEWDGASWTQRAVTDPGGRWLHAMAYDAARGVIVLFGGYMALGFASTVLADTWEWDGGTAWTQRHVAGPPTRDGHAMAYDARRAGTVLFGGGNSMVAHSNTWVWDGTMWTRHLGGPLRGHYGTAMAYDTERGVTVLFGGDAYPLPPWDTSEWDGTSWTQRAFGDPGARSVPAMAYDAARRVTVLVGGLGTSSFRGGIADTWEWDGTTWTQRMVAGPSARGAHAMAYDTRRGVTVLFGGLTVDGGTSSETWEWDGTNWTPRMVAGPSARAFHAMVYDTARGVTVLFGGRGDFWDTCNPLADTWEWDGAAWTQRMIEGPPARSGHAMAYDAARHRTVLFGGPDDDGATWELRVRCRADLNDDGIVDFIDYLDFLNLFDAGDPRADFNGDGIIDFADYLEFLSLFDAGC